MQMSDQREIAAPVSDVWQALLNAQTLLACVPGAQEITGNVEDGFDAVVVQKVGPVKATFKGHVSLSQLVEHQSLTLAGEGKGGAAGFAKGAADVSLRATAEGTLLSYDVQAKVGGKLAQLGSRLIDGFAKKMADQFFGNLQQQLEAPQEPQHAADPQEAQEASGQPDPGANKSWLKKLTGG